MPSRQSDEKPRNSRPNPPPVRRALLAVAAALAISGASVGGYYAFLREPPPGPDPDRVAELEASESARHVDQVGALIDTTRDAHDELLPVVEGLDTALPADGSEPGEAPGGDEVDGWAETVGGVAERLSASPSGDTDYNVARGGVRSAVDLLGSSVEVYAAALDAEGSERERLEGVAADLRTQAVRAWAVAATQLDVVAIEAGHGHVHIYLPAAPDSGALQPDSAPEGTGAHEGAGDGGEESG
ncbi:hypothetical protein O4J56_17310 [Nocardiopsis sp. RSe5-2]|uniref:Uncharacterized protein n=1 Tax=Nocardiopsis endophytica TaxID=3018445 RepID=A0ABT4U7I9_9ACTN|nr:hypothetical protein [Nocardiopsis endophytica]MDA2812404.1 hypothetical protein [Nocardiopsis endophytica]